MRISYSEKDQDKVSKKLRELEQSIRAAAPKTATSIIRKEGKQLLELSIDNSEKSCILRLFATLKDQYIIDTRIVV